MSTFIKTFVDDSTEDLATRANNYARENKLEIVNASISFTGAGKTYERPVMTVVYEDQKSKRKSAKPNEAESDG